MKITKETVEHVAHLARLELDPGEIDAYTDQIDRILEYMDSLNTVNTEGIAPTSHPVPIGCVMRDDVQTDSFTSEESVANAPERVDTFFKVPPIIEQE